jgi:hypothetical protein
MDGITFLISSSSISKSNLIPIRWKFMANLLNNNLKKLKPFEENKFS